MVELMSTKQLLILYYLAACTYAILYAPQSVLATINQEFPLLSVSTISLIMTIAILPLGFAPLIYGSFLSSFSARTLLIVCTSLVTIIQVGIYFTTSFYQIIILRMLQGLIVPAILTCIMAYISNNISTAKVQQALATYIGMTILGSMVGRLTSGFTAHYFNWHLAMLIWAVFLLICIFLLFGLKKQSNTKIAIIKVRYFKEIIMSKGVFPILLIDCFALFVLMGVTTGLPFRLQELKGEDSILYTALMYSSFTIGIVVSFYSSVIKRIFKNEVRSILIALCIYMASLPLLISENILIIYFGMTLMCTGLFISHSMSPGLINRFSQHDRSALNGLFLSMYYTGGALGSYIPNLIYTEFNWTILILCLMSVLMLAIFSILYLKKHLPDNYS